jgi:RNA polymerase sigma factor (sigma-70 family)
LKLFLPKKHATLTKEQLIKACQKGHKKEQYMLVERYSGMLMSICRRYAPNQANAQDILQESLIRIFKHIQDYQPTGSFEGWMKKITVRCALQWLKQSFILKESAYDYGSEEEIIEPEVYQNMNEEEIIQLIQELPDGYKAVFNLYVIEGYNHQEIAELLNIQESTSRSQLGRARKLLQKKLNTINSNY